MAVQKKDISGAGYKDCEKALIEWGQQVGYVTSWCWNDRYMNWVNTYYPNLCGAGDTKKAQRAFRYRINKLVEDGIFESCQRSGTGVGGKNEFGATTISIWDFIEEAQRDM